MGDQFVARNGQQGSPGQARPEPAQASHRRHAFRSCATQQAQQHGFRLVVAMMGKGDDFFAPHGELDCGMSRIARTGFAAAAVTIDPHQQRLKRHIGRMANLRAVRRPGLAVGMQLMIHMDGAQAALADFIACGQAMQQDR